jgi:DnaJ-class molecular chaperone
MAKDPYEVLGVKRDATPEEIRKAYQRHAKSLHPDLNPGDKRAEAKFKDLNAANDILSDPEKRAKFDRGEIDAQGAEKPQQRYYRDFASADGDNPYRSSAGFSDLGEDSDIFADIFSRGRGGPFRMHGHDVHYRLETEFLDAVNGASKQVALGDGKMLEITIPPGTRDGQMLRLRGKGEPGAGGAAAGDALIEIGVKPHRFFVRDGDDIRLNLPISLHEAVTGGKVHVPTVTGTVVASVPPWSSSGKVLRLKGRGVTRPDGTKGDQYVTLSLVLPEKPDAALEKFVAEWPAGKAQNPRQNMGAPR